MSDTVLDGGIKEYKQADSGCYDGVYILLKRQKKVKWQNKQNYFSQCYEENQQNKGQQVWLRVVLWDTVVWDTSLLK